MEQQFATFVKLTLKPYLQRIEQRVTRELLPSSAYAEFNVEGLLRGDSKARAAFYNAGITGGWLVPNEVRERENLQPVEWGDEPYRPYNQSAADQTSADTEDDTSGSSKED
jgi:HK97 family phage portal protein